MSRLLLIRRSSLFGAASAAALLASVAPAFAQSGAQAQNNTGTPGQATTSQGPSNVVGDEAHRVPGAGPTGDAQPAADANAPLAANASPVAEVVVLGVRGAQRAAVNIKRSAPQIVDSIVAEDIGKLPDQTIADSLQRVPGVQITRSAGEGAGVNIRGIPQVQTTLNGEIFLTAGTPTSVGGQSTSPGSLASAQPNFGDVPPSLFAGVDVIKSPTADQLSGGISGILALKTRRPLDLPRGLSATLSAQGDYGFRTEAGNQSYNGLLSYNWGNKFGALIGFAYTDETLANYNPSTGYQFDQVLDTDVGFDLRGDGRIGSDRSATSKDFAYQPVFYAVNNQTDSRQRTGINGSFQYKITDNWTATADIAYLHLDNRSKDAEIEVVAHDKLNVLQPGSVISGDGAILNGIFQLPTGGDGFLQTHSFNGLTTSDATNASFELAYNNHANLRASLRYVGAVAAQTFTSVNYDALANQRNNITLLNGTSEPANPNGYPLTVVGVDTRGDYPTLNFMTDVTDPNRYQAQSTWANGSQLDANINVVRGDVAYDTNWGVLKTVEAGARYSQRIIKFDSYKYETPIGGTGPNNLYYYKDSLIGDPNYGGASIVTRYPFPSLPAGYVTKVSDFGPVKGIPAGGLPFVNPDVMDNAIGFENSLYPTGEIPYTDPTASYRVTEKETSGYVQANFAGDSLPFIPLSWSGNVGVRVVSTDIAIRNFLTNSNDYIGAGGSYNGVLVNLGEQNASKNYIDPLPELNFTLNVTDDQKLRFAYNRAVARQNLSDLAGGFVASYLANGTRIPTLPADAQLFLAATSGNPDLDPYRANVVQGSYEWYFHRASVLSLAAFYVDVESFPLRSVSIEPIPDADNVVRLGGPVTRVVNGGGGSIKGVELGYQQTFDFLPGLLSGFGVQANYTYSSSETQNQDSYGNTLPVPDNSEHQINGVLFYQKGPLQARVAYNWRSEQFNGTYGISGSGLTAGIYTKPVGFLDASASYDLNPHVTFFAQGTNITSAGYDRYLQFPDLYYNQNIFEARATFGVRFRN